MCKKNFEIPQKIVRIPLKLSVFLKIFGTPVNIRNFRKYSGFQKISRVSQKFLEFPKISRILENIRIPENFEKYRTVPFVFFSVICLENVLSYNKTN